MINAANFIMESIPIGVFMLDSTGNVTNWNRALEIITGTLSSEVVGTKEHWKTFYSTERPMLADLVRKNLSLKELAGYYEEQVRCSRCFDGGFEGEGYFPKIGDGKWLRFSANVINDEQGNVLGSIETIQDITEERSVLEQISQSEARYKSLYLVDAKTRFQNSMGFELWIQTELQKLKIGGNFGIAIFDLQNLKLTNDQFGRSFGDHLIQTVSRCIKSTVGETDVCFRCRGGRFYVVATNPTQGSLETVVEKVRILSAQYPVITSGDISVKALLDTSVVYFSFGTTKIEVWEKVEGSLLRPTDGIN
jgi:diguanylate cyclase (GGDEF)-like protein/PAS domain S-box-containing protein